SPIGFDETGCTPQPAIHTDDERAAAGGTRTGSFSDLWIGAGTPRVQLHTAGGANPDRLKRLGSGMPGVRRGLLRDQQREPGELAEIIVKPGRQIVGRGIRRARTDSAGLVGRAGERIQERFAIARAVEQAKDLTAELAELTGVMTQICYPVACF